MLQNALHHPWNLSPQEAHSLQRDLSDKVIIEKLITKVSRVAGIDVSTRGETACAVVAVLSYPDLELIESAISEKPIEFPYIPGLLSFREGPVILEAFEKLSQDPDLLIFDGQGIAHPRRLGIASHIGLLLNLPSIGCAKSRLCGDHETPDEKRGSHVPLKDGQEIIGAVVRTRAGVKPVYVSPGHRIDLISSVAFVLACCRKYRLPETTRYAHRIAGA